MTLQVPPKGTFAHSRMSVCKHGERPEEQLSPVNPAAFGPELRKQRASVRSQEIMNGGELTASLSASSQPIRALHQQEAGDYKKKKTNSYYTAEVAGSVPSCSYRRLMDDSCVFAFRNTVCRLDNSTHPFLLKGRPKHIFTELRRIR